MCVTSSSVRVRPSVRLSVYPSVRLSTNQCPATGEELTADDLLEVRSDKAVKPRPVEAASIPGLLAIMQVGETTAEEGNISLRMLGQRWGGEGGGGGMVERICRTGWLAAERGPR